jgi:hypothetical protein
MQREDRARLTQLRYVAGKRRYDIIRSGSGSEFEKGLGYRLVMLWEAPRKPQIVVGHPAHGPGATLDEIEDYLNRR